MKATFVFFFAKNAMNNAFIIDLSDGLSKHQKFLKISEFMESL